MVHTIAHESNILPCLGLFVIWHRALPVVSCAHPADIHVVYTLPVIASSTCTIVQHKTLQI